MGRWHCHFQIIYYWYCLLFAAQKSTSSVLLQSLILIWRVVSVLLLALGSTWSSFRILCSRSGCWLHSRRLFSLLRSLNRWMSFWRIISCPRDNIWLSIFVFDCIPQNIALPLMSFLILDCSVGGHSWDSRSGKQNMLQLYSDEW